MNYWFISDTHFYHANIIKYCSRPFQDSAEMTEAIIRNWNSKVQPQDLIYHLGDFTWGDDNIFNSLISRLNGLIVFIKGNHDRTAWRNREKFYAYSDGFREIEIQGQAITLCHYALATWNKKHHGAWCLCGHSHYNLPATRKEGVEIGKILDVGVDGNDFSPYSFEDIQKIMDKKPKFTNIDCLQDHHGERD